MNITGYYLPKDKIYEIWNRNIRNIPEHSDSGFNGYQKMETVLGPDSKCTLITVKTTVSARR